MYFRSAYLVLLICNSFPIFNTVLILECNSCYWSMKTHFSMFNTCICCYCPDFWSCSLNIVIFSYSVDQVQITVQSKHNFEKRWSTCESNTNLRNISKMWVRNCTNHKFGHMSSDKFLRYVEVNKLIFLTLKMSVLK